MSASTVAIVGSGIVGTTIANLLTQKGHDVTIFEKGPEYPYPHLSQFREKIHYLYDNPIYKLPEDLKNLTLSGDYLRNLNSERDMRVGGSATRWRAYTFRMNPTDFRTKSLYGYGEDWPLTYNDLEPYYCKAEEMLGVSGTNADNPFAPWRSKPYPLPPFELSYDDLILAERLQQHGLALHTTPQARTRTRYEGRPGCINFGECKVCPIGARYSPNYHLRHAMETGLCEVLTNVTVRRIVMEKLGKATSLVYQFNNASSQIEHNSRVIIIAGGTIESARLLLLSKSERYSDGIGNEEGRVGKNLMFNKTWKGHLQYKDFLYPGRFGGITGHSQQFLNPQERGKYGGMLVLFSSDAANPFSYKKSLVGKEGSHIVEELKTMPHTRKITFHAETIPSPNKYMSLSEKTDRFGDRFAHINYELADSDYESYTFAREVSKRFEIATDGTMVKFPNVNEFHSGFHHTGTCRMGHNRLDSVTDSFGKIHSSSNLFVVGGSNFVGTSPVNQTLTITALAIRTADYIADQVL